MKNNQYIISVFGACIQLGDVSLTRCGEDLSRAFSTERSILNGIWRMLPVKDTFLDRIPYNLMPAYRAHTEVAILTCGNTFVPCGENAFPHGSSFSDMLEYLCFMWKKVFSTWKQSFRHVGVSYFHQKKSFFHMEVVFLTCWSMLLSLGKKFFPHGSSLPDMLEYATFIRKKVFPTRKQSFLRVEVYLRRNIFNIFSHNNN